MRSCSRKIQCLSTSQLAKPYIVHMMKAKWYKQTNFYTFHYSFNFWNRSEASTDWNQEGKKSKATPFMWEKIWLHLCGIRASMRRIDSDRWCSRATSLSLTGYVVYHRRQKERRAGHMSKNYVERQKCLCTGPSSNPANSESEAATSPRSRRNSFSIYIETEFHIRLLIYSMPLDKKKTYCEIVSIAQSMQLIPYI